MIPPIYFLKCDFGNAGRESIINYEDCSRESITLQIMRGDFGGKLMDVFCWEQDDDSVWNVSEDIAREIWDRLAERPTGDLLEFLEEKLGLVRGIA